MSSIDKDRIRSAALVLGCSDLAVALDFYTQQLGFRLDAIFPADDPRVAVISGHGMRIRLDCDVAVVPVTLRLAPAGGTADAKMVSPDGTRIELEPDAPPLALESVEPSFMLQRATDARWGSGRAGMHYRDLIPGRMAGHYIASHIRIPDGGPVPDYVHYHHVVFQMIYCWRGWVRVVYEDQGLPFVMRAGDCVLQPPHIRHRVLECSDGLEVIEFGSPAEHLTAVDHHLDLPTSSVNPDRDYSGQHFVFHQAAESPWRPGPIEGFEFRDSGIGVATKALASARVLRPSGVDRSPVVSHDAACLFNFVLGGSAGLDCEGRQQETLACGDAFVIPAGLTFALTDCSANLRLLQIALPGRFQIVTANGASKC